MKRISFKVITSLIVVLLTLLNLESCIAQRAYAAPKILEGAVAKDQLADALTRAGLNCILQQGAKPELTVESVRMGSVAFYQGLVAGDSIRRISAGNGSLTIQFQRGAAVYQVQFPLQAEDALNGVYSLAAAVRPKTLTSGATNNDALLKKQRGVLDHNDTKVVDVAFPGAPIADIGGRKIPIIDVKNRLLLQSNLQKLAQYNIEVIIDRTGSMSAVDGTDGLTKFEWCHRQVRNLAYALSPFQNNITITTFNTTFLTTTNCSLDKVEQLYGQLTPSGETDLVEPLMARLDAASAIWHQGAKRTLIAVIHDGLPNVPVNTYVIDKQIIEFTKQMQDPNEVIIAFLQIGASFDGKAFCDRMDTGLMAEGAKYDIVNTIDFPQLKKEGLVNALLNVIIKNAPAAR